MRVCSTIYTNSSFIQMSIWI